MTAGVQCAVPVHAQLGPLDHGRGHPAKLGGRRFRAYSAGSDPIADPIPR